MRVPVDMEVMRNGVSVLVTRYVTIPDRLTCDVCGTDESKFIDNPMARFQVICPTCGNLIAEVREGEWS